MTNSFNGELTIGYPRGGSQTEGEKVSIRLRDHTSRIEFVEIEIDYLEFTRALSSLCYRPVTFEVRGLDKIGMTHEYKSIAIPLKDRYEQDGAAARKRLARACKKMK